MSVGDGIQIPLGSVLLIVSQEPSVKESELHLL